MNKIFYFTLLWLISGHLAAQHETPKLVVGIVVDQMKQEYLLRFKDKFGEEGFKRMIKGGFMARNAHYNYIPTYTGPGHASIYTGTTPSQHGIIANNWYSRPLGRSVYCAGDTGVSAVGGTERSGKISPRNLMTSTITDELKLTTNFRAKIVGVAIKDRGAALPAGHVADGAYWYDSNTGTFMTSTYYMEELPAWVERFNEKKLPTHYLEQTWNTVLPIDQYTESLPDDNPYENTFKSKDQPVFPYNLEQLSKENWGYSLLRTTPFGNTLTLDFALAAIEGEGMGKDDITDFLTLSFSSTDYIGHFFGPNSIELEDTYIRLDRELARLFRYLDEEIGKDEYVVFLSADHGVVANPQFLADRGLPGGYIDGEKIGRVLRERLRKQLGDGEWIENISNYQVFLDRALLRERGIDLRKAQRIAAEAALQIEELVDAYPAAAIANTAFPDALRTSLQNGYHRKRSGDVLVLAKPGYLTGKPGDMGTSHGTGYAYDTHIPVIFYGKGVPQGSTVRKVNITDIAPTLSMLLGISLPASVSGEPITEIFE